MAWRTTRNFQAATDHDLALFAESFDKDERGNCSSADFDPKLDAGNDFGPGEAWKAGDDDPATHWYQITVMLRGGDRHTRRDVQKRDRLDRAAMMTVSYRIFARREKRLNSAGASRGTQACERPFGLAAHPFVSVYLTTRPSPTPFVTTRHPQE